MVTSEHTYIGIFCDYEFAYPVTVLNLRNEMELGTKWTATQYCDRRYSTNLERFNYDPWTGEKIDWKEVKRLLTQ